MVQVRGCEGWARLGWKPRSRVGGILLGVGSGAIGGLGLLIASLATSRWTLREVPLWNCVAVFPALGALTGYAGWRRRRVASIGEGQDAAMAAAGPDASPEQEDRRRARRLRYLAAGLAGGCVLAFIATATDFAWRG
jgi:hypothetical protein